MELANLGEAAITSERELEIAMASSMPISSAAKRIHHSTTNDGRRTA
jgi:hypothetical protein